MQTSLESESGWRSRDSRCVSCITIDDDDDAAGCCSSPSPSLSLSSSSEASVTAAGLDNLHQSTNDESQTPVTTRRHFVSLPSDLSDFDDLVTDDVMVSNDARPLCCYGDANRGVTSPRWSIRGAEATMLAADELAQSDTHCCVCKKKHKSPATELRQHSSTQQHHDPGISTVGLVVTCYSNDQLGIRKTTANSRSLGVVKTTIESTPLGLVETTVKLDGCPLVRTTLNCRDLDLTETRLYSKELGVLKTTLRSGQGTLIKSSVHENLAHDPRNTPCTHRHDATHKIENKKFWRDKSIYEERQAETANYCKTVKSELERQRRTEKVEAVSNITKDCHGCDGPGRRLKFLAKNHHFIDDSESGDTSCKFRRKNNTLPLTPAQCRPASCQQNQNEQIKFSHTCELADSHDFINVFEDQSLTSGPLLSYNIGSGEQDGRRVQSGAVSSTSSSLSGDDMLIIDSLSDDDVNTDRDADDANLATDVGCDELTAMQTSGFGDDSTVPEVTIETDFSLQDMQKSSQDYEDKHGVMLLQQQLVIADQEVTSNEAKGRETNQMSDTSKSDLAIVSASQPSDESCERVSLKPCRVLLRRLSTNSFSYLPQRTVCSRSDMNNDASESNRPQNPGCVANIELTCENTTTAAARNAVVSNLLPQRQGRTMKWQRKDAGSREAVVDSVFSTSVKQLHLDEHIAPGRVNNQQISCNDVKSESHECESLKDGVSEGKRILGVVKGSRKKTSHIQPVSINEVSLAETKTRKKTRNSIKSDQNIHSNSDTVRLYPIHDAFAHGLGVTVSEQNIDQQVNCCVLSHICGSETQQSDYPDVTDSCELIPAVESFQSSSKRKVRQAFSHISKSFFSGEDPKKKKHRSGVFWNLTKQQRSLKQKRDRNKPYKIFRDKNQRPSKIHHLDLSDKNETVNSAINNICQKPSRKLTRKRRSSQPAKIKEVKKRKTNFRRSEKADNTTWEIASLALQEVLDSKNNDNKGESDSSLMPVGSKPECEAVSHYEEDDYYSQSINQSDDAGGDCDESNIQRDPIIVRFRRQPSISSATTRQQSDVMRQVIAEIRRVHRRLDFVLLQRRRRRQCTTSSAHTCTGVPAASAVAATYNPHCIISADRNVSRRSLPSSTNGDDAVRENSVGQRGTVSTVSESGAMWPVQLLVKSRPLLSDRSDTNAVELLLCGTEQGPLAVDRILACLASPGSFILFAPCLNTCPTKMLLMETQLAGDVSRMLTPSLAPEHVRKKKQNLRRLKTPAKATEEEIVTNKRKNDDSGNKNELAMIKLPQTTDDEGNSTAVKASSLAINTLDITPAATNCPLLRNSLPPSTVTVTEEDVESMIEEYPGSTESSTLMEHIQLYATSNGEQQTQAVNQTILKESLTATSISRTSLDVDDSGSVVDSDRPRVSNQRPRSVGVGKKRRESSTPHRPAWLTPHVSQMGEWQSSVSCPMQRTPAVNPMHRHYPLGYYHQSPAGPSPAQPRRCATPRDHGLSRVLPTLSLFDTELDLSECELASHCDDDVADVDELMTTGPSYQHTGSTQQTSIPWSRQDSFNSAFTKPEPRHPYDGLLPPHQPRDYGLYQNQFYTVWPAANSAGSGQRLYRPRSRACTWWSLDSDQPAPASCYNTWSPYQHSHYRYHHHPYQR